MALKVPAQLAANCRKTPERTAWLGRLPDALRNLERRWSLTLHAPFEGEEVSCAWVAPVILADGTSTVLKLGMPHLEVVCPLTEIHRLVADRPPARELAAALRRANVEVHC